MRLILFFSILLFFTACSNEGYEPIILNGIDGVPASHEELANNVFIDKPAGYRRAKSFVGFQAINVPASLSLEIRDQPFAYIQRLFEADALSARGEELVELHPVNFYGNEAAFLAVTRSSRKGIFKFLLAVGVGNRTYNIKALCSIQLANQMGTDEQLKKALLSTRIALYKQEATDFVVAYENPVIQIFTRDGKSPTESSDSVEIVSSIYAIPANGHPDTLRAILRRQLKAIAGVNPGSVEMEPLHSGFLFHATAYGDSLSAFMALAGRRGETTGIDMSATSKTASGIDNAREFVLERSVKSTVGGR